MVFSYPSCVNLSTQQPLGFVIGLSVVKSFRLWLRKWPCMISRQCDRLDTQQASSSINELDCSGGRCPTMRRRTNGLLHVGSRGAQRTSHAQDEFFRLKNSYIKCRKHNSPARHRTSGVQYDFSGCNCPKIFLRVARPLEFLHSQDPIRTSAQAWADFSRKRLS